MAGLVDHNRNKTSQQRVLASASGRHIATGHIVLSETVGTSPTHQISVRHALGFVGLDESGNPMGSWEEVEGVWFRGLNVPAADFEFHDGTQTSAPISALFPTDKQAHTGAVIVDFKAPVGVGDEDTEKSEPTGFAAILKCQKFPDFDADGNQVDPDDGVTVVSEPDEPIDWSYVSYTANPARVAAGWLLGLGGITRTRINWETWVDWRDYCDELETVDYTSIEGFDGFGLTGRYYQGTNFGTLRWQRIDPVIQFTNSTGSPALELNPDDFSVRWTGFIKFPHSGTWTLKVIHDNGVKVWVDDLVTPLIDDWQDDGLSTPATTTDTFDATAGTFYPIKLQWNDAFGPAEFQFFWSHASQSEEIVPAEYLYPEEQTLPRYEAHVAFSTPTTVDEMLAAVLRVSKSVKQEVGGKMEFYCVEQLTASFDFDETAPESERQILRARSGDRVSVSTLRVETADRRVQELQNVFEAKFRDLDSQFLEEPIKPIQVRVESLITEIGREIYGEALELFNMTRWQARKVLQHYADRVTKDETVSFDASARAFAPVVGDLVTLTNTGGYFDAKEFQVFETLDKSPQVTARERYFVLREF